MNRNTNVRNNRIIFIYIALGVSVFIAIFLVIASYVHQNDSSQDNKDSDRKDGQIGAGFVLDRAKLFLHVLVGRDAVDYYNYSDRPPEVEFHDHDGHRLWYVFFNYGGGGFTILLSENAGKANYRFQNGRVIRRYTDGGEDSSYPPLYTLEEMVDLLKLPHNRFD